MTSLLPHYEKITQPGAQHRVGVDVSGTTVEGVSTGDTFWTVSVDGPDSVYTINVQAFESSVFKPVEDGVINGTPTGFIATFAGSIKAIQIVPTSGSDYSYSIVGQKDA